MFLLFLVGLHLGTSSKKTVAIRGIFSRCLKKPINSDHVYDESSVNVSCAPGCFCLNSHVDVFSNCIQLEEEVKFHVVCVKPL